MPPKAAKTASPHRFFYKKSKTSTTTSQTGAPSARSREIKRPEDEIATLPTSTQFAQTPRFSHGRTGTNEKSQPQVFTGYAQALRATTKLSETVDDADFEDDDEMLDDGQSLGFLTTENGSGNQMYEHEWSDELQFSPKRRKLDSGILNLAESFAVQARRHSASQFARSDLREASLAPSTANASDNALARPIFVRPTSRGEESKEPVPEIFSPHRRGAKFLAGGLAATTQQWVLDAGQAAAQSRRGLGYLQGEVYQIRGIIEGEVQGDGPFTLTARTSSGDRVKLLLGDNCNGAASIRRGDICIGTAIGIRAPVWEVELQGESWTVAVDWRILQRSNE